MNKPDKKDYDIVYFEIKSNKKCMDLNNEYVFALEKYVSELENELEFAKRVVTPDCEKVQMELQMYQKALEKACDKLKWCDDILKVMSSNHYPARDKDGWKEWALKETLED